MKRNVTTQELTSTSWIIDERLVELGIVAKAAYKISKDLNSTFEKKRDAVRFLHVTHKVTPEERDYVIELMNVIKEGIKEKQRIKR